MFDFSHYYYRYCDELGNRLDALYNDQIFDVLDEYKDNTKYPIVPLYEVVDFLEESRNPQGSPEEEFIYIDIGCIDTLRGVPIPETLIGYQATSTRMRRVIKEGNVLVSTTRPTRNAICVIPEDLDDQICSTGFAVMQCKPDMINKFLFYALRSKLSNIQLERLCSGSGYPAINIECDLPQVNIPKPDIGNQKEIILSLEPLELEARHRDLRVVEGFNTANVIFLNELGIPIPQSIGNYYFKTGAENTTLWFSVSPDILSDRMHYLCFHPRYAEFNELNSRYDTVPLASICAEPITRGEQPEYDECGDIMVVKTADLKNAYVDYASTLRVSTEFYNDHPESHVKKGDILVASTGYVSLGKVDVFDSDEPALVDGHVSIIRVNDNYDPYFIAFFLRSHLGQIQFEKWFTGSSGQIEIQPDDLNKILVPSSDHNGVVKEEQQRIANIISKQLLEVLDLSEQARKKWEELDMRFEDMVFSN